jgi:hypothetical protein
MTRVSDYKVRNSAGRNKTIHEISQLEYSAVPPTLEMCAFSHSTCDEYSGNLL